MTTFFGPSHLQDAPFIKFLFSNTKMAWLWLIVRIYVGYKWVDASLHKLAAPEWMQTGEALKGYWTNAVSIPEAPARAPIYFDWYRSFIQSMLDNQSYIWFAKLVAIGELLVGISLIIGLFVGLAAFFGGLMNFNFLLAGSLSSGPLLLILQIFLMIAWKIAGHIGINYFIHKRFGTFWQRGTG
ncbi:MAG TPA: DoxX family membrane protein [Anaerolineaceae bacterium]|nr:DoxX family membrane protein [Anaerolineaceae bacterium]